MPLPDTERDAAYLWDIRDAAQSIVEFTNGLKIQDYMRDRKLQLAVERLLEIIGEAAKRVSSDFQEKHPEIPWRKIIAQRNVIAHEYGEIKQERIWTVISTKIPELLAQLAPVVKDC